MAVLTGVQINRLIVWNNNILNIFLTYFLIVFIRNLECTEQTSFIVKGYKFRREWTFIKNDLSMCLFHEVNTTTGAAISAVCDRKLSPQLVTSAASALRGETSTSGLPQYLQLSCHLNTDLSEACVCGEYRIESEWNKNPVLDSKSSISHKLRSYVASVRNVDKVWPCQHKAHVSPNDLLPFRAVTVLSLSTPSVQHIALTDVQPPSLKNLELLKINYGVNLDDRAFGDSGLCNLANLTAVVIENTLHRETFISSWFFPANRTWMDNGTLPCRSLRTVILQYNSVQRLQNDMLAFAPFVQFIQLRNNDITTVEEMAFAGLFYLVELSLSHNAISQLPHTVFDTVPRLQYLDLSYNQLNTFNATSLASLKYLLNLDLSHNALVAIEGNFNVVPFLTYLNVSHNNLPFISNQTFMGCTNMGILKLHHNNISYIEDNSFRGVLFLMFLDVSYNQLSDSDELRRSLWGNLERLQILNLEHNNIKVLLPQMFQQIPPYMTSLVYLGLGHNQITTIYPNAFQYLFRLKYLRLDYNPLKNLSSDLLHHQTNLNELSLGGTNLTDFPPDILPSSTTWLALMDNKLKRVPRFNGTFPRLTVLILTNNDISELSMEDFTPFPNLVGLNISRNYLKKIPVGTFLSTTRLVTLDLSHNQLDLDFSEDIFLGQLFLKQLFLGHNTIRSLSNLFRHTIKLVVDVDLSNNPITEIPDQPKVDDTGKQLNSQMIRLHLRGCNISQISESAFANAFDLGYLDLSNNLLTEFKPLEVSNLSRNYIVNLNSNPLKCSCRMKWLKHPKHKAHFNVDKCEEQFSNSMVTFRQLDEKDFLCKDTTGSRCLLDSNKCTCFANDPQTFVTTVLDCSYRELKTVPSPMPTSVRVLHLEGNSFGVLNIDTQGKVMNTETLYLQNSEINDFTKKIFSFFPYLTKLRLDNNNLTKTSMGTFSNLKKLKDLCLASNNIDTVAQGTFHGLVNLETLHLNSNKLQQLNTSVLEEIDSLQFLTKINLQNNPWSCDCDNLTFKSWLQEHSDVIENLTAITCNDTSIINMADNDLLCYDNVRLVIQEEVNQTAVILISIFAVFVSMLTIILIVIYLNRFVIEVLIYNRFGFRFRIKENPYCVFDAFMAYDGESLQVRLWIRNILIPHLEPTFRVCVPDRDILPGTVYSDAIVESIQQSHRTIVVLSDTGMNNENFLFAFQAAYYRMKFEDTSHRICVVLLNGVKESSLITSELIDPHLNAMLRTKQRLQEQDKLFWEKVQFCMPKPSSSKTYDMVEIHTGVEL